MRSRLQVKHLLELDTKEVLKIPAVGVKVFERQNNKTGCDFRMAQEGLPLLLPFVGRQIFHPTPLELRGMLHYRGLRIGDAADGRLTLSDGRTVKELEDVRGGCCVAVLR